MSVRRRAPSSAASIGEAELAAVAPSLFARPALWPRPRAAGRSAHGAGSAPWSAYWAVRLGDLADPAADRAVLEQACSAFESRGERLGEMLALAAAIETYYFDETELQPLDALISRLDAVLGPGEPAWPNPECAAEVMACGAAIRLRQPAHPRLAEWAAAAPRALTRTAQGRRASSTPRPLRSTTCGAASSALPRSCSIRCLAPTCRCCGPRRRWSGSRGWRRSPASRRSSNAVARRCARPWRWSIGTP